MTEERIMENYYVYENWTHDFARIHKASCSCCNDGKGFRNNTSDKNGRWLGSFKDKQEAELVAQKTRRKTISNCLRCL